MLTIKRRPITEAELAVTRHTLTVGRAGDFAFSLIDGAQGLFVVGGCGCGCPTVEFESPGGPADHGVIADGIGLSSQGRKVGVMVWGSRNYISGLEVYGLEDPHPT